MTPQQAEELHQEAESERAHQRDNALDEWNRWYDQHFPRPEHAVPLDERDA